MDELRTGALIFGGDVKQLRIEVRYVAGRFEGHAEGFPGVVFADSYEEAVRRVQMWTWRHHSTLNNKALLDLQPHEVAAAV